MYMYTVYITDVIYSINNAVTYIIVCVDRKMIDGFEVADVVLCCAGDDVCMELFLSDCML